MKKVLKGKITLIEQEGGWCSPTIVIGESYLDNILLKFPHIERQDFDIILKGEYKMTIEKILTVDETPQKK